MPDEPERSVLQVVRPEGRRLSDRRGPLYPIQVGLVASIVVAAVYPFPSNAYVLARYRNRAVGRQLLDALLRYAIEQNLARVVLRPSTRSIPFYQRAGFAPADMLMVRVLAGD